MKRLRKGVLCCALLLCGSLMTSCAFTTDLFSSSTLSGSSVVESLSSEKTSIADTQSGEISNSELSTDTEFDTESEEISDGEISTDSDTASEEVSESDTSTDSDSELDSDSDETSDETSDEDSSDEDSSEDDEPTETPVEKPTYERVKSLNDATSTKTLIKTTYKTDSALVVDAIATDFGADPTGRMDSTNAIQLAVNSLQSIGGGTVFGGVGDAGQTGSGDGGAVGGFFADLAVENGNDFVHIGNKFFAGGDEQSFAFFSGSHPPDSRIPVIAENGRTDEGENFFGSGIFQFINFAFKTHLCVILTQTDGTD